MLNPRYTTAIGEVMERKYSYKYSKLMSIFSLCCHRLKHSTLDTPVLHNLPASVQNINCSGSFQHYIFTMLINIFSFPFCKIFEGQDCGLRASQCWQSRFSTAICDRSGQPAASIWLQFQICPVMSSWLPAAPPAPLPMYVEVSSGEGFLFSESSG